MGAHLLHAWYLISFLGLTWTLNYKDQVFPEQNCGFRSAHDLEALSCLPTPAGFCAPVTLEIPQLSMRVYGHYPHSSGLSSPDKGPCLSLSLALWHRDSEARVLDLEPVMTLFIRLTLFSLRFHICMLSVVTVHSH